ncbi:hypothetical protein SLS62_008321 [Diatrype stigma]|uniref:ATPase AAA-type core domain-containing protein n=1 Tax=Diatrype stigma TaxID=117547 RepID=A0AAN9UKP5_9PEZI
MSTEPGKVEKYLKSVLHLGNTWDCVVLIDEAEVLLEQRSLDNLERNALVSVFLRVLEYREGILILTSNRNLTRGQRTKIWKNFLARPKKMDDDASAAGSTGSDTDTAVASVTEPGSRKRKFQSIENTNPGIDFHDIDSYIDELAAYELNGRHFRNVITVGRQYASFKREPMAYHHLKHVINVSGKFESYLKQVQEEQSDDAIMRSDGIR